MPSDDKRFGAADYLKEILGIVVPKKGNTCTSIKELICANLHDIFAFIEPFRHDTDQKCHEYGEAVVKSLKEIAGITSTHYHTTASEKRMRGWWCVDSSSI